MAEVAEVAEVAALAEVAEVAALAEVAEVAALAEVAEVAEVAASATDLRGQPLRYRVAPPNSQGATLPLRG
jgi:hypothetical protein